MMMRVAYRWFGLMAVLIGATLAAAQSPDYHLTADPVHQLYSISAFAHGQRHGYEDGFYDADVDIHMARGDRQPVEKEIKVVGYRPEFGQEKLFKQGYRLGYIIGYQDSYAGRAFRGTALLRAVTISLPSSKDVAFEQGVAEGYGAGTDVRVNISLPDAWAHYALKNCPAHQTGQSDYCSGYAWGYLLGTIYQSPPTTPVLQVRARR